MTLAALFIWMLPPGTARANLEAIDRALDRANTLANFYSSKGIQCTAAIDVQFADCKKVAEAIARLQELHEEIGRLKGAIDEEERLTTEAAKDYISAVRNTKTNIANVDFELMVQDAATAMAKAALLSGDLAIIKRRLTGEGSLERHVGDLRPSGKPPFVKSNPPARSLDRIDWNISDGEAATLRKILDIFAVPASILRDESGIYNLSTKPGSTEEMTLFTDLSVLDGLDVSAAAYDLSKMISKVGVKEALKRPGPRGAILLFIEKAGDYIIKHDRMKRLAYRTELVSVADKEQVQFNTFLARLELMRGLQERRSKVADKLAATIVTLGACLKSMCPDVQLPKLAAGEEPAGSFGERQRDFLKRMSRLDNELTNLSSGLYVTLKKKPPAPGESPEDKVRIAQLNAELSKVRRDIKSAMDSSKAAYRRLSTGQSGSMADDKAIMRSLRQEIKELRQKEAQLEQKRAEIKGENTPRKLSVKLSTELPGTCGAGETCLAKVKVTNAGGDLFSVAMPVIFNVSAYLPATLQRGDGWACATAGRQVTCLADALDLKDGGEYEFAVPLQLPGKAGGRLDLCASFAELDGLREGRLNDAATRLVQLALTSLGLDLGRVDGKAGPATRAAAGKFGEIVGLQDGPSMGAELINALFPLPMFSAPPDQGGPNACVSASVKGTTISVGKSAGSKKSASRNRAAQKEQAGRASSRNASRRPSGPDAGSILMHTLDTYRLFDDKRKKASRRAGSGAQTSKGSSKSMVRSPPPELIIPAN